MVTCRSVSAGSCSHSIAFALSSCITLLGKGKMGAKQDAKATKPQNQLGGTPIRVLAMHPRIRTLRFLPPLEPAEAMTASYFRLKK